MYCIWSVQTKLSLVKQVSSSSRRLCCVQRNWVGWEETCISWDRLYLHCQCFDTWLNFWARSGENWILVIYRIVDKNVKIRNAHFGVLLQQREVRIFSWTEGNQDVCNLNAASPQGVDPSNSLGRWLVFSRWRHLRCSWTKIQNQLSLKDPLDQEHLMEWQGQKSLLLVLLASHLATPSQGFRIWLWWVSVRIFTIDLITSTKSLQGYSRHCYQVE